MLLYSYSWTNLTGDFKPKTFIFALGSDRLPRRIILNDFKLWGLRSLPRIKFAKFLKPDKNFQVKDVSGTLTSFYRGGKSSDVMYQVFCNSSSARYGLCENLKNEGLKGYYDEASLKPHQQIQLASKLKICGWMNVPGDDIPPYATINFYWKLDSEQFECGHDILTMATDQTLPFPIPKMMAYDCETFFADGNFPIHKVKNGDGVIVGQHLEDLAGNCVFQISAVFQDAPDLPLRKKIISLRGNESFSLEDTETILVDSEYELLKRYIDLVKEEDPIIIVGHNILAFDDNFLMKRAQRFNLLEEYRSMGVMGMNATLHSDEFKDGAERRWSRDVKKDAQKDVLHFQDMPGRILIDSLLFAKGSGLKLANYKLDTLAGEFLPQGEGKKDLSPHAIFQAYRNKDFEECASYCVRDSEVVINLVNKLNMILSTIAWSELCRINPTRVWVDGQQIRSFMLIMEKLRECHHYRPDSVPDYYRKDSALRGATVLTPVPGVFSNIVTVDFASLYPSIIIGFNICMTTLLKEDEAPDRSRHIFSPEHPIDPTKDIISFQWSDHAGCNHDPLIDELASLDKELDQIKQDVVKLTENYVTEKAALPRGTKRGCVSPKTLCTQIYNERKQPLKVREEQLL